MIRLASSLARAVCPAYEGIETKRRIGPTKLKTVSPRAVCPAYEGIETALLVVKIRSARFTPARSAPLMRGLKLDEVNYPTSLPVYPARSAPLMRGLKHECLAKIHDVDQRHSRAVCPAYEGIETRNALDRIALQRGNSVARSAPLMRGLKHRHNLILRGPVEIHQPRGLPRL